MPCATPTLTGAARNKSFADMWMLQAPYAVPASSTRQVTWETAPDLPWLTDITQRPAGEGKLYLSAAS
jgi:transposase InsO family protein